MKIYTVTAVIEAKNAGEANQIIVAAEDVEGIRFLLDLTQVD